MSKPVQTPFAACIYSAFDYKMIVKFRGTILIIMNMFPICSTIDTKSYQSNQDDGSIDIYETQPHGECIDKLLH